MTTRILYILSCTLLFSLSATDAQNDAMANVRPIARTGFNLGYEISSPDTSFVLVTEGWQEIATLALVAMKTNPVPFETALNDTVAILKDQNAYAKIVQHGFTTLKDMQAYLLQGEFNPPPGKSPFKEPFIVIILYCRMEDQKSVQFYATFPKSDKDRLYDKMFASFASFRKKS